ncbi:ribosome recycling factor [Candidatus Microgenomates bacterium]|nr:ribosome recycling factor [Candidatus Microgenomates bacterium]
MARQLVDQAQPRLQKAVDFLLDELKGIRTGRATPPLVEDIAVEAYGQPMTIKQVASINTPDAKSLTITPWDSSVLAAIEKAIREAKELDLNPINDGKALHITIPPLTADRREQMVKQVGDKVEACYIGLRNIRHEVLNEARRQAKDKLIGEDDYHWVDKEITQRIDQLRERVEEAAEQKRNEIRRV